MLPHSTMLPAGHSAGPAYRHPRWRKNLKRAILAAFAIETLSVTWCMKIPGLAPWLSIPYFISGVSIAWLLLYFPVVRLPSPGSAPWKHPVNIYRLIGVGVVALMLYSWSLYWFEETPIDISNADMLPIIKVMGYRFLAGRHSHVYDPISSIWHGVQPIYLPAMWLPYVPALSIGIDMRWVSVAGLLFAFSVFLFLFRPKASSASALSFPDNGPHELRSARGRSYTSVFLAIMAFLLFWWMVADNTSGLVSMTEEGVVIAYYVLLALALFSRRAWLIGIAASLCMLSRYALVGWIPAFLLYLALEKKGKDLLVFAGTGAICFVLLFLLPVGWSTFIRLASLPGGYIDFAGRVWHDSPDTFSNAPGFAWFFGPHRIAWLHDTLVAGSFLAPPAFVFISTIRSRAALANIPLASLKLSLVIFYCFIDVPYLYLFYTSSLVSLIAITLLCRKEVGSREEELPVMA